MDGIHEAVRFILIKTNEYGGYFGLSQKYLTSKFSIWDEDVETVMMVLNYSKLAEAKRGASLSNALFIEFRILPYGLLACVALEDESVWRRLKAHTEGRTFSFNKLVEHGFQLKHDLRLKSEMNVTESPEWKEVEWMLKKAHDVTGIQAQKHPEGSYEQGICLGKQGGIGMALNYMRDIPVQLCEIHGSGKEGL